MKKSINETTAPANHVAIFQEPVMFCHGFKLQAPDGEQRETDCANSFTNASK